MREIKFRAWDTKKKEMRFPPPLGEWDFEDCELFSGYNKRPTILMQFTGLKDKNGKEIYEGDIVEYENSNSGYGRPRHEEISRDIIPHLTEHEDFTFKEIWWKCGEVLGNIYENPELCGER